MPAIAVLPQQTRTQGLAYVTEKLDLKFFMQSMSRYRGKNHVITLMKWWEKFKFPFLSPLIPCNIHSTDKTEIPSLKKLSSELDCLSCVNNNSFILLYTERSSAKTTACLPLALLQIISVRRKYCALEKHQQTSKITF